jgi:ATP-dependent DNA ligase
MATRTRTAPAAKAVPPPAPIEPMLAKLVDALPPADGVLFEPKWDGFRAIVFRPAAGEIAIQSRDLRPLDRYFPELDDALVERLPVGVVVDGEIVVVGAHGLDFDALQQRLHPAASRVAKLAVQTPASFVAFDLLVEHGRTLVDRPLHERRAALEARVAAARPPR